MKTYFTIPTTNLTYGSNKATIEKALKSLNAYYLVNWEVMEDSERLEHLELIANLTDILLNMEIKKEEEILANLCSY